MGTANYAFGQNGTRTAEGSSGLSGTYFWVYTHTTVSNVKIYAEQKIQGQDSYLTMVLTTSGGLTVQETVEVSGGKSEYSFSNTISVEAYEWFNITFWTNNTLVYWDDTAITDYIATGWTGSSSSAPSSISPYSCKFTIAYDPLWVIDSSNDGYPHIASIDVIDWQGFEKDADGYPLNFGVWKLDGQNDGYPWIVGYLPSHVVGGAIYKKVNGTLIPVQIYKKVNGTLIPVQIYKKVNGTLIPIS